MKHWKKDNSVIHCWVK